MNAAIAASFLVATFLLLKATGQLDGPASRGKSVPWKKDEDPALASDASPVLYRIDKLQWIVMSRIARFLAPKLFPPPPFDTDERRRTLDRPGDCSLAP